MHLWFFSLYVFPFVFKSIYWVSNIPLWKWIAFSLFFCRGTPRVFPIAGYYEEIAANMVEQVSVVEWSMCWLYTQDAQAGILR